MRTFWKAIHRCVTANNTSELCEDFGEYETLERAKEDRLEGEKIRKVTRLTKAEADAERARIRDEALKSDEAIEAVASRFDCACGECDRAEIAAEIRALKSEAKR